MDIGNEKYRMLLRNLPDAFAYHQMVTDSEGNPVDYIFLDINRAFENMTGLSKEDIIGKKVTEVLPGIENSGFDWIGTYGQVALNGETARFKQFSEPLGRWYEVTAYSDSPGYFATIFQDIDTSEKEKFAQEQLLESSKEELKKNEEKLRSILDNMTDVVWSISWPDFKPLYISPSAEKVYGNLEQEFYDNPNLFKEMTHPDDQHLTEQAIEQLQKEGEAVRECRVLRPDGSIIWINDRSKMIYDENQQPIRVEGVARDITEQKQTEEELEQTKILLEGLFESIQDGISVINADLSIRFTNNTIKTWHESDLPLEGKKCYEVYHEREIPCDPCPSVRSLESKKIEVEEIKVPTDLGWRWLEIYSYPLYEKGYEQPTGVVEFVRDVTDRKQAEERIRYMSFHDSLTGLYNRYFLEEEMQRLDTARQLPISIIMIDVNGLKLVNDTYGHAKGDEMLKDAAGILKKSCREEDVIARWGGDEFVILLPQTAPKEAEAICRRIKDSCQEKYVEQVPVSLSLGYACKESMDKELWKSLREAENNMYKQKLTEGRSSKSAILNTLLNTLGEKSQETERHIRRIQRVTRQIGEKLDLSDTELDRLKMLARLHDIGKINIPENILNKRGSLTEEEWAIIKEHPEIGYRIARATEEFSHVAEEILSHHERWDGSGYPQGLKGKNIPLLARIVAIADAYEVMSNGRPYKEPMDKEEIKKEFIRCAGTQFDPELVDIFLSILEE